MAAAAVESFLRSTHFIVVGASANREKFGNKVDTKQESTQPGSDHQDHSCCHPRPQEERGTKQQNAGRRKANDERNKKKRVKECAKEQQARREGETRRVISGKDTLGL